MSATCLLHWAVMFHGTDPGGMYDDPAFIDVASCAQEAADDFGWDPARVCAEVEQYVKDNINLDHKFYDENTNAMFANTDTVQRRGVL